MSSIVKGAIILSGLLTRHDAFDTMRNLPPLPDNSYHYVTADDCRLVGEVGVMVVRAREYNVIVGDCAQTKHLAYRRSMSYVSDVDKELWHAQGWPDWPIAGTIYLRVTPQAKQAQRGVMQ